MFQFAQLLSVLIALFSTDVCGKFRKQRGEPACVVQAEDLNDGFGRVAVPALLGLTADCNGSHVLSRRNLRQDLASRSAFFSLLLLRPIRKSSISCSVRN